MPNITRRTLLAGSALSAAAPFAPAVGAAMPAGEETPGIYRYRIGTFQLTALYDGIWYRPITDKFIRNAPFAEVESALADAFMPADKLATPFTTLIVNTGAKLVLIDTGTGGQIAPSAGVLRANLLAAGIDPKAIDLIVISHFHPDHINGIKDRDNDLVFPNAEIMVAAAEWKFWMDDANLNAAPADLKLTFRNQRRIFSDIARNITRFESGRGGRARHRHHCGAGPHAGPHCVCHSFRRSVAHGARRYGAAPGGLRPAPGLAGGLRYRRRRGGCDTQDAVRSRRGRSHAGDRVSLPLPGLRPSGQNRKRLRARASRVAGKSVTDARGRSHSLDDIKASRKNPARSCRIAAATLGGSMKSPLKLTAALLLSAVLVAPDVAAAAGEENPTPPASQNKSNKGTSKREEG